MHQHPVPSNQYPAPSTQHPATSNQQPAPSNQQPEFIIRAQLLLSFSVITKESYLFTILNDYCQIKKKERQLGSLIFPSLT